MEIIPGILEKEWSEIEKKIEIAKSHANVIHIDLIDGLFASSSTFADPTPFSKYSKDISFELHIMTEEPINYLKTWADAGFKKFIGHVEKMESQEEFVAQAQILGEVYLAIDLNTPPDAIKVPYEDLDGVLVMSVVAGQSNQNFNNLALSKIDFFSSHGIKIEVDGGINPVTLREAKDKGARQFVSTGFLFSEGDFKKNLDSLRAVFS